MVVDERIVRVALGTTMLLLPAVTAFLGLPEKPQADFRDVILALGEELINKVLLATDLNDAVVVHRLGRALRNLSHLRRVLVQDNAADIPLCARPRSGSLGRTGTIAFQGRGASCGAVGVSSIVDVKFACRDGCERTREGQASGSKGCSPGQHASRTMADQVGRLKSFASILAPISRPRASTLKPQHRRPHHRPAAEFSFPPSAENFSRPPKPPAGSRPP